MSRVALPEKAAMTVPEFVGTLGVSREHVYRQIQKGTIPSFRVGGRLLIPTHWVRDLLEGSPTQSESPAVRAQGSRDKDFDERAYQP